MARDEVNHHDCHIRQKVCTVIEMSHHRRVLYSFARDVVMVAVHPKM